MSEDLDKHPDGNIVMNPLLTYQTATPGNLSCFLRIIYASNPEEQNNYLTKREGGKSLQLIMHPEQALALSEDLAAAAQKALKRPGDDTPMT
jgi:hypothetical protein